MPLPHKKLQNLIGNPRRTAWSLDRLHQSWVWWGTGVIILPTVIPAGKRSLKRRKGQWFEGRQQTPVDMPEETANYPYLHADAG